MRLKKIKGADEIVEKNPFVVKNPSEYRTKWQDYFKNSNPIHLEIGCGKGDFLIHMAQNMDTLNFIGIEKYPSVLIKALKKLENKNLSNICFLSLDASKIEEIFTREIDVLYLNFSDPWPKKKHHKRRLTSPIFLQKYENIFKNTKKIIMKTDNQDLFEYSLKTLSEQGYIIKDISLNLHKTDRPNILTEYEEKWSKKGYPIYYVVAQKN